MALLDGQYNILSEQDLGPGRSLFEATKRSGERVRILWYELTDLDDELAFEDYRQLLRQLKQQELAAIHDIVSRPGANYVVWEHPVNERAKRSRYTSEFADQLEEAGYRLDDAHIHVDELSQAKLYMLELYSGTRTASNTGSGLGNSLGAGSTAPPKNYATHNTVKSVNRKTISKTKRAGRDGQTSQTGLYLFGLPVPPLISWIPGILMTLVAAVLLNYSFGRYVNTQEVLIPDLVKLHIDVAGKEVQSLGLNSKIQPVISNKEEGTVVNMQPKARSLLRQGRTVQLMYAVASLESKGVLVPQLVARGIIGEEAAKVALEEAGLKLGKAIEVHSSLAEGRVIAQSVAARKTVGEGSSLDVIFSKGPRNLQTFMPDFRGMTLEEAQPYIDLLGLTQTIQVDEQDSEEDVGTILKQYIKANTIVDPTKTTLRLLIAKEAEAGALRESSIPNFIGILSLDRAYNLAAEYGFEIAKVSELNSPNLNHGVIAQTPLAYEALPEITDQVTLIFNTNVQHLTEMQNRGLGASSASNLGTNLTPLPTDTTIGVAGANQVGEGQAGLGQAGVNPIGTNPIGFVNPEGIGPTGLTNPTTGTGVIPFNPANFGPTAATGVTAATGTSLAPTLPQTGTSTIDSSTTDTGDITPVTTLSVETTSDPLPDAITDSQVTNSQASAGNFSYRWSIPPVAETKLVAVYVTFEDGSSINTDSSWLEVGTTEFAGVYSYPGYSGELVFELRDYQSNEVIGQALVVQN